MDFGKSAFQQDPGFGGKAAAELKKFLEARSVILDGAMVSDGDQNRNKHRGD
jgi:hypothetical protein